eukprot:SM000168S02626  [mRNA]  locus=s168:241567:246578:+ [translate_table: standard]
MFLPRAVAARPGAPPAQPAPARSVLRLLATHCLAATVGSNGALRRPFEVGVARPDVALALALAGVAAVRRRLVQPPPGGLPPSHSRGRLTAGLSLCSQPVSLECKAVALERTGLPAAEVGAAVAAASARSVLSKTSFCSRVGLSEQKASSLRKELQIRVRGKGQPPAPILAFSNLRLPLRLLKNLENAGYLTPTPIQMQVIPAVMGGHDILAMAQTGSGKTAAYVVPLIAEICSRQGLQEPAGVFAEGCIALVLGPTRELCAQIEKVIQTLAEVLPLRTALIVGGNPLPQQLHRLQQKPKVIVATPGRLWEVLLKQNMSLSNVVILVIDEVDTMLQLGFKEQVMQLVQAVPQPQTLMFSATIPQNIQDFAKTIMNSPLIVTVGKADSVTPAVQQTVIWVENKDKRQKLFDIFADPKHFHPPTLVFVESRLGAEMLASSIRQATSVKAESFHGEKDMSVRRSILHDFICGELQVLVATGVLGRGLHLGCPTQVIVYDMPMSIDEYVHLIGRASQVGKGGLSIAFPPYLPKACSIAQRGWDDSPKAVAMLPIAPIVLCGYGYPANPQEKGWLRKSMSLKPTFKHVGSAQNFTQRLHDSITTSPSLYFMEYEVCLVAVWRQIPALAHGYAAEPQPQVKFSPGGPATSAEWLAVAHVAIEAHRHQHRAHVHRCWGTLCIASGTSVSYVPEEGSRLWDRKRSPCSLPPAFFETSLVLKWLWGSGC